MSAGQETLLEKPGVFGWKEDVFVPEFPAEYSLPVTGLNMRYQNAMPELAEIGDSSKWAHSKTATPAKLPDQRITEMRSPAYKVENAAFTQLQKWEGRVLEIGTESFWARLHDLMADRIPEDAEFSLEEVPVVDQELLREGAVFYWSIGYLDQLDGQRYRTSSLRFRRRPVWSSKEIQQAEKAAEKWACLWSGMD